MVRSATAFGGWRKVMFSVVVEVCVQYVVWESDQGNIEAKGSWKEGAVVRRLR